MTARSLPLAGPAARLARSARRVRPARLPRPAMPGNRRLLVLVAIVVGLGAAFLVLRESSFVEVRDVTVSGITGPEADAVRGALVSAAEGQSTLAADRDALLSAVEPYPIVKDVEVATDFPHGMTISIVERELVAAVEADGRAVPVAADGTILRGTRAKDLPVVPLRNPPTGSRIDEGAAAAFVAALAAAPPALRARVERVGAGDRGMTVALDTGVEIYLGRPDRLAAKWTAATTVLADPTASGATYVDVRLPGRPAAGGLEQVAVQQQVTAASGGTSPDGTAVP